MTEDVDLVRQLVELAVTSGRSHQSAQTSFVHWFYGRQDEVVNHTIPLYENFLFALALMRMRTQQNVLEAREILKRLLPFQGEDGNYPIYLHQYPNCNDRFYGVHILVAQAWILKQFSGVLGTELKEELEASAKKLIARFKDETPPFQLRIKIAGALASLGKYFEDEALQTQGLDLMETLRKESLDMDFGTWYCPEFIAETLAGLSLVYDEIAKSPWSEFWQYLTKTWNQKARTFIGPAVKLMQKKGEPEATLYDLFLGDFSGGYPYHAFEDHPYQLKGALVHDMLDKLEQPTLPFTTGGLVAGQRWFTSQSEDSAWCALEANAPIPPEIKKWFHYFRLVFGDANAVHSMSCQGGRVSRFTFEEVQGGVDLIFTLAEPAEFASRDNSEEIQFYIDKHEALSLLVWDKKATTFDLEDVLTITSGEFQMRMQMELLEGDGRFHGTLMPANRPSQMELKGESRFEAFDWKIALRCVRRSGPCKIKVRIRVP